MEKVWARKDLPEGELIKHLMEIPGVDNTLAVLMAQRDILTLEDAREFFNPAMINLIHPLLMPDMAKAIRRVEEAMREKEKILIYGDYDVDGTTAVSLFYSFLKTYYKHVDYYIPDRYLEGYGISRKGIEYAREEGFTLVISLDCGVKSVELITEAKAMGIDFIVCDHHEPGEVLPPAVAVLDAKRKDSEYPYKELSGCGVGFKLAQALTFHFAWDEADLYKYMDLVAVSIACDIVDMTGENRVLTYYGMQKLNRDPCLGLKVLLEKAFEKRPKKKYDISDVVFYAGPRINAAGRLDHAYNAVDLLIETDEKKAREFAAALHETNSSRKELEQEITRSAIAQCESMPDFAGRKSTVVYDPEWNKGVIGIVASRLVEQYHRPTIVLTASGDKVAGSARSVNGFDIHSAIEACGEHLLQFGGHTHAAGLTLLPEKVEDFRNAFDRVVASTIPEHSLRPTIEYDLDFDLKDLSLRLVNNILRLEPFGPGNMNPLFVSRKVKDTGMAKSIGEHLSLNFFTGAGIVGGMAFSMAHYYEPIRQGRLFDMCYHIELREFNGRESLQFRIIDIKLSDS